jgi:hypothetical protein
MPTLGTPPIDTNKLQAAVFEARGHNKARNVTVALSCVTRNWWYDALAAFAVREGGIGYLEDSAIPPCQVEVKVNGKPKAFDCRLKEPNAGSD